MLARSIYGCLATRLIRKQPFSAAAALRSNAPHEEPSPPILPSREFMKAHVRTPLEKERLTSVISEITLYREFHGPESIPILSDKQWESIMSVKYPDERCDFLAGLHADNEEGESEERGERVEAGGGDDCRLIDLRGQELRKQMDSMYGSRLLAGERVGSNLPRLIMDARFLSQYSAKTQPIFTRAVQEVHNSNWSSPHPFNISIANFRPDAQVSELVKRHWNFLYGPPSSSSNAPSFRVHPLAPSVSPRSVMRHLEGVEKNSILYISQRAKQFLPERPPEGVKAVVMCLSTDISPHFSASTAAVAEGLKAYRIPLERYVNLSSAHSPPLPDMVETLRGWMRGEEWRDTIRRNVRVKRRRMKSVEEVKRSEVFMAFKSAVLDMNNQMLERRRREEKGREERREEGRRREKRIVTWRNK